jgi:hypothetical protein
LLSNFSTFSRKLFHGDDDLRIVDPRTTRPARICLILSNLSSYDFFKISLRISKNFDMDKVEFY